MECPDLSKKQFLDVTLASRPPKYPKVHWSRELLQGWKAIVILISLHSALNCLVFFQTLDGSVFISYGPMRQASSEEAGMLFGLTQDGKAGGRNGLQSLEWLAVVVWNMFELVKVACSGQIERVLKFSNYFETKHPWFVASCLQLEWKPCPL